MDVTFFEQHPYYKNGIQGENYNQEYQFLDIDTLDSTSSPNPVEPQQDQLLQSESLQQNEPSQCQNQSETPQPHQSEKPESYKQTPMQPRHLHPHNEFRVYSRKSKPQERKEPQVPDQSQESNPDSETAISPGNTSPIPEKSPIDDRPIALRKGRKMCTNHPIYNFVSYKRLSQF